MNITVIAWMFLYVFLFIALWALWFSWEKKRYEKRQIMYKKRHQPKQFLWYRLFRVPTDANRTEPLRRKLSSAGFTVQVELYLLWRRLIITFVVSMLGLSAVLYYWFAMQIALPLAIFALIIGIIVQMDHWFMYAARLRREKGIVKDVYRICQQLLYYAESRMNLHAKLMRCVLVTGPSNRAFTLMLNEWYEDPFKAIETFKYRMGTNEAYDLAELLHTLRLDEHEAYYELLRARVRDYKEKMELSKDSAKETRSYVLFVLAGLPILNTFRVFIYPWVKEGEKLFQLIQS